MTPEEEQRYLEQNEERLRLAEERADTAQNQSAAMFSGQSKQNLVEWQLDFRPELEDIERLLKCDIIKRDTDGNEYWVENPNEQNIVFNSLGVNDIIREIRMFLNKNKVLSNYALDEIKPRVKILGHEIRALIYNNYESYGIDNDYKMNNYPIVVLTILDMIDSAYRRAINGEERKDLNQARIVNQNEPMMPQNINMYPMMPQQRRGIISRAMPWNWGKS
jgi:hypothetical protein